MDGIDDQFGADKALTIISEPEVDKAVDDAVARFPSAHDVYQAAIWRIARDPECGTVLEGHNPEKRVLKLPSHKLVKSPGVIIRYFREGRDLTVDWVKFLPYNESSAVVSEAYVYRG